jgi:hypothetical protein
LFIYGVNDQIEKNEMGRTYGTCGREERRIQGFGGDDPSIDGRIILRWIFRRWNVGHRVDQSGSG